MKAVTDTTPADRDDSTRLQRTRRVTWIGIAANVALAGFKTAAGVVGHSQALVADGIHSLSDLASDGVVLLAARHAAREADHDHPYGHGRFETAATVVVGLLLLFTALLIAHNAIESLDAPDPARVPAVLTLTVALASVLAKEGLYRYTRHCGRAIGSRLLEANAWHHRTDALSSIVVAVGIGGALAGMVALDAVAALIVAAMVAKVGWDVIRDSLRELVDTGLDSEALAALQAEAAAVDGVAYAHTVRSRWMGPRALVDLHIRVGARISVSEGHRVAEAVRLRLLDRLADLADVMVHVDPEEDTDGGPSNALPLRAELEPRLLERARGNRAAERIEDVTLHYLEGRVQVEVVLAAGPPLPPASIEALRQAMAGDPDVGSVGILERTAPA